MEIDVNKIEELNKDIVVWHKKTFPDCHLSSQLLKLEEELGELLETLKTKDLEKFKMEYADVYIVSVVLAARYDSVIGAYFVGVYSPYLDADRVAIIRKKLDINKCRKWNKNYHHERKES